MSYQYDIDVTYRLGQRALARYFEEQIEGRARSKALMSLDNELDWVTRQEKNYNESMLSILIDMFMNEPKNKELINRWFNKLK